MEKIKEIFWFWRWLEEEHPVAYEIVMTAEIFLRYKLRKMIKRWGFENL